MSQIAAVPLVRFSGSVAELHNFIHPILARPEAFFEDRYVSRTLPGQPDKHLETAIMAHITDASRHDNILLHGLSGSGKSMVMGRLERLVKKAGLPVCVTNGAGGWKEAETFLKTHKKNSKVVILANEVGMYMAFNAEKLLAMKSKYPNLVIVGEMESSSYDPADPDTEALFPKSSTPSFEVLPISTEETVRMLASVLDYCGFTGFTQSIQEAVLKRWPQPTVEMLRHKLLDLTEKIPAIRSAGQTDNRLEAESIPEAVFKEIFDLKA